VPPPCDRDNEPVYVPPGVVENVKPDNGPTVTLAVVSDTPVIVNEFGPVVAPVQTFPKLVNVVVEKEGHVTVFAGIEIITPIGAVGPQF